MKNILRIRIVYSIFYSLYLFYLLYGYLREKYILLPIYTEFINTETIEEVEREYLSNDMGVTIFHAQTGAHFEDCLFVFNGAYGNSNLKYILMRQLQQTFDRFTIIQMEYPGYGFCPQFQVSISEILEIISETYYLLLSKYSSMKTIGFFGEQFGSYVQAHVSNYARTRNIRQPDFVIELNGISSLFDFAVKEYNVLLIPFQMPLLHWHKKEYRHLAKNTPIFVMVTDDNPHILDSIIFFHKTREMYKNVKLISLQGKKTFGFLLHENQNRIDEVYRMIQDHCKSSSNSIRMVSNSPP